jgi:hypothetical protein
MWEMHNVFRENSYSCRGFKSRNSLVDKGPRFFKVLVVDPERRSYGARTPIERRCGA